MVDSSFNNGISINATFSSPVVTSQPYVAVVENNTASSIYIASTNYKTDDGLGENLACAKISTSWYPASLLTVGAFNFDADFLIHPIIDYTLADPTFTKNPNCLTTINTNVAFDVTAPAMYTTNFYNWWAFSGTPENSFLWDYGDGSAAAYNMDHSHLYASAALHNINMYFYFEGWTAFTAVDSVEDVIDICSGINENTSAFINVYPNPATDLITLENAEGYQVSVLNMLGQEVITASVTENRHMLNLSALAKGAYLIRFTGTASSFSNKLIVE
jgi:hypothetical protein